VKNVREIFEDIKGTEASEHTVFISDYHDDIISQKGMREEGFDLISKSIHPDTLMRRIRDVLDR
jgi:DNA-binding NarL/FixJ family response regulator